MTVGEIEGVVCACVGKTSFSLEGIRSFLVSEAPSE